MPIGRATALYASFAHPFQCAESIIIREPEAVSHHPAGDLPRRSPLQRFDHFEAIVVRQPNVEDQVHVIFCGIDVCDQGLDAGIGIRQQFPRLPPTGSKPFTDCADAEQMRITLWDLRLQS